MQEHKWTNIVARYQAWENKTVDETNVIKEAPLTLSDKNLLSHGLALNIEVVI